MLTLTINQKNILIPVDFSMQLTWKSPMCDFEKIPSGYGLGISIPESEFTRSIFGHPERFSKYRDGNDQKFPGFEVRFSGVLLMAGTLKINGYSNGKYEAVIIDQVGELGEKERERDILEIERFGESTVFENKSMYDPDIDPYCCFPIRNTAFFTERGHVIKTWRMVTDPEDPNNQIREYYEIELLSHLFQVYPLVASNVNALNTDGTVKMNAYDIEIHREDPVGYVNVVSPFFFLNHIMEESLKDSGFFLNSTNYLKTHVALKNLVIYNNFDITQQTFSLLSPESPYYIGDSIKKWTNEGDLASLGYGIGYYRRKYNENNVYANRHLPKMKVGDMLLSTQNLFNVCFHFLPNNTINVHSREAIIKSSSMDLDQYFIGYWAIGEKKNVALKFTREYDSDDLLFAERFTDLSDRRKDLKIGIRIYAWSELATKVPNPEVNEIRYIETEQKYVEYKWITQSFMNPVTKAEKTYDVLGWEEISIGFQNGWFQFGREEVEEIKTNWSTTYRISGYPEVNQQGNMSGWMSKNYKFGPRLLFYQPYNNMNRGNNYYNLSVGNNLTMEYEPTGDSWVRSILPTFWRHWNYFWANRLAVSGEFDLPVNVLRHLIWNICQKYRTREGEFIIEEMSCEIFVDVIGTTKIKGFKI